jgi:hypothetical protein
LPKRFLCCPLPAFSFLFAAPCGLVEETGSLELRKDVGWFAVGSVFSLSPRLLGENCRMLMMMMVMMAAASLRMCQDDGLAFG